MLCCFLKPKSSGGIAYLTTQTVNDLQPKIILDKEELDKTLLSYSQQHFAHAQGSPFTIKPLSRLLQYVGLTQFGDRIYQGRSNFNHLEFDEPTRTLLKHLKNKTTPEVARTTPLIIRN